RQGGVQGEAGLGGGDRQRHVVKGDARDIVAGYRRDPDQHRRGVGVVVHRQGADRGQGDGRVAAARGGDAAAGVHVQGLQLPGFGDGRLGGSGRHRGAAASVGGRGRHGVHGGAPGRPERRHGNQTNQGNQNFFDH